MNVRPAGRDDAAAICELVDDDRPPGQPACQLSDVGRALDGEADVDRWWWDRIIRQRAMVATDGDGQILGAAAAGDDQQNSRFLLWLHARERELVVDRLITELLADHHGFVYAFWFATPLHLGLEGLPVGHRPTTHEALLDRGLQGDDLWLYMRAEGPGPSPATALPLRQEPAADVHRGLRLELLAGEEPVAEATIAIRRAGIGVLWWIETASKVRGRGLGRQLLRAARHRLAEAGATQTILFVDHADHDRRAAISLYETEGFQVIDHLWSYRSSDAPAVPPEASPALPG